MPSQSMSNERKPNLFKAHLCLMEQYTPSELRCGWEHFTWFWAVLVRRHISLTCKQAGATMGVARAVIV
jgi:hypothetical protein